MPTPLGHSLIGLAVMGAAPFGPREGGWREEWRLAVYCVAVANIADLDFIWWNGGGFSVSGLFHHGISHSLGFALIAPAIAGTVARLRGRKDYASLAVLTAVLYSSHLLADFLNEDTYPLNGTGLPALWPLTDEYYIYPILPGVNRNQVISWGNVEAATLEILFFGGAMAAIWGYRSWRGRMTAEAVAD